MEGHLLELGSKIKCMAKVYSLGQMVENMREIMLRIRRRAKEYFTGLMEDNIRGIG